MMVPTTPCRTKASFLGGGCHWGGVGPLDVHECKYCRNEEWNTWWDPLVYRRQKCLTCEGIQWRGGLVDEALFLPHNGAVKKTSSKKYQNTRGGCLELKWSEFSAVKCFIGYPYLWCLHSMLMVKVHNHTKSSIVRVWDQEVTGWSWHEKECMPPDTQSRLVASSQMNAEHLISLYIVHHEDSVFFRANATQITVKVDIITLVIHRHWVITNRSKIWIYSSIFWPPSV